MPTTVEDWDIADPADKPLDEVRAIRDELQARVLDLVDNRLDEIRSDRTAHQFRLARLLPPLIEELEGRRSAAEIRACADAILTTYDDVPVRSFVMPIARRRTAECLREKACHALTTA